MLRRFFTFIAVFLLTHLACLSLASTSAVPPKIVPPQIEEGDITVPGYPKSLFLFSTPQEKAKAALGSGIWLQRPFTLIPYDYAAVAQKARDEVAQMIQIARPINGINDKIRALVESDFVRDRPYVAVGAEGEGNWVRVGGFLLKNGIHIQQDPVYRTDQYVCNTLVQTLLGVIHSNDIDKFEDKIINIEYGAAGDVIFPVTFFNRNNFVSSALNPVNEKQGYFKEATAGQENALQALVKTQSTNIDTWGWLIKKRQNPTTTIRVLYPSYGLLMHTRLVSYPPLLYRNALAKRRVSLRYIPKGALVSWDEKAQRYVPNMAVINKIEAPASVQIVRDDKKWILPNGQNIKNAIGSGILVSHLGLVYRDYFVAGQVIYQSISCNAGKCAVTARYCTQKEGCQELMMAHATDAYPNDYLYWQDEKAGFHCTAKDKVEAGAKVVSTCNRVVSLPLKDYLLHQQNGHYIYLTNPSILGMHFEQIL